jgi:hypothetical protein
MDSDDETTTLSTGNTEGATKQVKLPYFHRTLSPQDTALIGDTTPKPISTTSSASSKTESASAKINESSAWNSANTWEERDYTAQAKAKVLSAFAADQDNAASTGISVKKIEKVEGHASITHVRGRARYMYEWSFSLDFESSTGVSGSVAVSDVINDQLNDVEMDVKWKGPAPARDVAKVIKDKLKAEIVRRSQIFEESFRQL